MMWYRLLSSLKLIFYKRALGCEKKCYFFFFLSCCLAWNTGISDHWNGALSMASLKYPEFPFSTRTQVLRIGTVNCKCWW